MPKRRSAAQEEPQEDCEKEEALEGTVERGVLRLLEILNKLAPRLRPNPIWEPRPAVEILRELFPKEDVDTFVSTLVTGASVCSLSGEALPKARSGRHLRLLLDLDDSGGEEGSEVGSASAPLRLLKCLVLSEKSRQIHDLADLMSTSAESLWNPKAAQTLVSERLRHFMQVNGQDMKDTHLFSDAVNTAYAASVLTRQMKGGRNGRIMARRLRSLQELQAASTGRDGGEGASIRHAGAGEKEDDSSEPDDDAAVPKKVKKKKKPREKKKKKVKNDA